MRREWKGGRKRRRGAGRTTGNEWTNDNAAPGPGCARALRQLSLTTPSQDPLFRPSRYTQSLLSD